MRARVRWREKKEKWRDQRLSVIHNWRRQMERKRDQDGGTESNDVVNSCWL